MLLTEVLERVAEPARVLSELARILRPGGGLLLTVPFVFELHEEPWDHSRFTNHGLRHLLEATGFAVGTIEPLTGWFSTLAQILRHGGISMRPVDGRARPATRAAAFAAQALCWRSRRPRAVSTRSTSAARCRSAGPAWRRGNRERRRRPAPTRSRGLDTAITSAAQVLVLGGAAILGVLIGARFGATPQTDGFFTANALYGVTLFLAQSLRTTAASRLLGDERPFPRLTAHLDALSVLVVASALLAVLAVLGVGALGSNPRPATPCRRSSCWCRRPRSSSSPASVQRPSRRATTS